MQIDQTLTEEGDETFDPVELYHAKNKNRQIWTWHFLNLIYRVVLSVSYLSSHSPFSVQYPAILSSCAEEEFRLFF